MKRVALVLVALTVVFLVTTAESCEDAATDLSGENDVYTMAMYKQVKNGMSFDEVDSIMGGGGTEDSSTEISGTVMLTYSYMNPSGSNCMYSFEDDKLYSKAQFGLE